jgi:hypothetical protein
MKWPIFFGRVTVHLASIMAEGGFRVWYQAYYPTRFGNCAVVLESGQCRLGIVLDRGQVVADVGPLHAPQLGCSDPDRAWFDVLVIVSFLSGGREEWAYELPKPHLFERTSIDSQLARLVGIITPHWRDMVAVFSVDSFQNKHQQLIEYREAHFQARMKASLEKRTPA